MKQGPAVIVNDRIRGSKHYQPVTVRKRLLKPLQSLQRQRAIVQRAKMIRGQLENLPEIGCRDSMIASRAFHGALVEMRFGVTRTQLQRSGEQLTRPVNMAKLCVRHRKQMRGVKMFWRKPESPMIDTGGLLQEVCKSVLPAKVNLWTRFDRHSGHKNSCEYNIPTRTDSLEYVHGEPKHTPGTRFDKWVSTIIVGAPLRGNKHGGVMFHARRADNADVTEAMPQFGDNLLPSSIEDVVGDGHLPAAQKIHHDPLPAIWKTG